jgi:hypothetical protein
MMGRIQLSYRLPLVPPSLENQARIRAVLEEMDLVGTGPSVREKEYAAGGSN